MQPLPSWLTSALDSPYRLVPKITWSPDWENWYPLRPLNGSHTQSRTQTVRWSFSGTFARDYPVGEDGLHPYGCRARIVLGIKSLQQPVFWINQGVYTLTSVEESEEAISLNGSSFEIDVQETDFLRTRRIPDKRHQSYRAVAETLIREAVPDARFLWDDRLGHTEPCPTAYLTSGRWTTVDGTDEAASIMGALGGEAYCDSTGGFRFTPVPTLDDTPVWRVTKGGALVSRVRGFDRQDVFNVVSASGDSSDGQKSVGPVFAWDGEPSSITYAGADPVHRPGQGAGRFGVRPFAYTNNLIDNEVQGAIAAKAQLANKLGLHYTVNFNARYHPGIEAGDVVEGETEGGRIERYLLDAVAYTWGAADMQCEVRSPKEVLSAAARKSLSTRIRASDETPVGVGDDSSTGGTPGASGEISFTATGGRAFQSDGDSRSTTKLYQGYYDSTNGNQRSMVSFDYTAIAAALAGKTVTGVTLRFRTQFSYYAAGMTAVIGTHNDNDISTYSGAGIKSNRVQKTGMTAGEWATVSLGQTIAQEFQANTAKGIAFGPGPSTSKTYYGYHYLGNGNMPTLTFSYS